jgi:biopolymer transport protein ExbD
MMGISLSSKRGVLGVAAFALVAVPFLSGSRTVAHREVDAELAPIDVAVHGDGSVSVEADGHASTVMLVDLATAARPLLDAHPGRPIRLDVADQLPYQIAIETIDTLRSAGGGRVALARR